MSSLQNIDKSLVLSLWVCVKENSSSAERGDLDFILGFPGGKLHDLERGINEEPFRGAGHFQLPLMALELCALTLLGKLALTLGQALTTLTFWWLCSCFFCPILWWLAPNVQEPSSKGLNQCPAHSSARFAAWLLQCLSGSFSMSRRVKTRLNKTTKKSKQTAKLLVKTERILIKYLDHSPCSEIEVIFLHTQPFPSASLTSPTLQTPGRMTKVLLPWWLQGPLWKDKVLRFGGLRGYTCAGSVQPLAHLLLLLLAWFPLQRSRGAAKGQHREQARGDCALHELSWLSMKEEKDNWCKKSRLGCGKSFDQRSGAAGECSGMDGFHGMIPETEAGTHLLRLHLFNPMSLRFCGLACNPGWVFNHCLQWI